MSVCIEIIFFARDYQGLGTHPSILSYMLPLVLLASVHCSAVGNGPLELWGNTSVQPLCVFTIVTSNPSVDSFRRWTTTHMQMGWRAVHVWIQYNNRVFHTRS